jgi:hypothetical protein
VAIADRRSQSPIADWGSKEDRSGWLETRASHFFWPARGRHITIRGTVVLEEVVL